MRYEVNTVMLQVWLGSKSSLLFAVMLFQQVSVHLAGQGLVQPDIERVDHACNTVVNTQIHTCNTVINTQIHTCNTVINTHILTIQVERLLVAAQKQTTS